jgi:hypothetical protein
VQRTREARLERRLNCRPDALILQRTREARLEWRLNCRPNALILQTTRDARLEYRLIARSNEYSLQKNPRGSSGKASEFSSERVTFSTVYE